ncbi:hypothetical protein RW1_031_01530 [Rhodococcus wratislaviensis NBRC 100605]|uniref:Uncharacterized protein n=1 Tax=Rhodococcus wratislaviensis NBRC 100605 TaxID=1219028 RepID=X0PTZ6_RHOWR|nr:hypothetical protein RW1_031_01530 [Rhodococcus wratislaviensis NBRC 100605]
MYEWEQTKSQGLMIEVDHATLGTLKLPGPPLRFFDHAGTETTEKQHRPPPVLGSDGPALRDWLAGSPK